MTARVSARDQDYMKRLGAFKSESKRASLAEHRSLSVSERVERGLMLARRRPPLTDRRLEEDLAAFFERARRLGLYKA